jgi:hypothetical protein
MKLFEGGILFAFQAFAGTVRLRFSLHELLPARLSRHVSQRRRHIMPDFPMCNALAQALHGEAEYDKQP